MNTHCTYEGCKDAIENPTPSSKYCRYHAKVMADKSRRASDKHYRETVLIPKREAAKAKKAAERAARPKKPDKHKTHCIDFPVHSGPKSMYALTDDLREAKSLGLMTYGQLQAYRAQKRAGAL